MTSSIDSGSDPFRFEVGTVDCTLVSDGSYAYPHPAEVFFADAPPDEREQALADEGIQPDEWKEYVSPYPSLVIDAGDQTVLVDTGGGEMAPTTGKLQTSLDAADIDATAVDVVLITHGHADHVGGMLTDDGDPAFPNARYVMPEAEWEFWTGADPDLSSLRVDEELRTLLITAAQANLEPLDGRIELVEDETEIVPGVRTLPAPGHTPGHVAVEVTSNEERLLHLVDTVLHPLHIAHPEWTAAVDYNPDQTVETRRDLLDRASQTEALVFAFHFPAPGLGHITATDDAWEWHPIETPL
ncbi:MBL fold metallo-hydrolase [Halostella sp. JP-L12]|uniref:MBL fold metallo-hydrolase n=1 Tax=Halostella TaxID=1843185 RepID=UPI0013CF2BE2|nr:MULTISPECIES: MBL fold metallo-hydrolase [Halostella]NHN46502.1 MBL fold metallo-hydrolase [Halostella sp. JP-L12]